MFRPGQLFDIASVGRRLGSALSHSGSLASISSLAGDTLGDDTWLPALIAVGVGAVAVGTGVGLVPGVGALGVLALRPLLRRSNNPNEEKPELKVEPEPEIKSIPMALAYELNKAATRELQDALVNLMDEPDWGKVKRELDEAAKAWCIKQIQDGKVGQLEPDEMRKVLLSLISNVREAAYRELFAEHYRKIISVDRRDRVEDVFIRLKADVQRDARGEIDEPEDLDFHGDTPIEIEVTLRRSNNLVILGEPGSGKSALLRHLAASCAESESANPLLPVFMPLTKYTGNQENIIADRAVAFAQVELQIHLPDRFFEDALDGGRCLVCLDALDEVPEGERQSIAGSVEDFVTSSNQNNPNNRFIVTSRLAGYDEKYFDEKIFTRYVAEPMDDAGVKAFIDWRFGVGSERARNLCDVLNANPNIKALVSNPLLMTMFNMVYLGDDQEGLPLKKAEFYKKAVEKLIKDEDFGGDADDRRRPIYKYSEDILAAVAHHLHTEGREAIGKNPLTRVVAKFLINEPDIKMGEREARLEAQAFVGLSEQRTGLLVGEKTGRSVEFRFSHSTFREYLAARHIYLKHYYDDLDALWEEIKDHITDDRWWEVIVFLLSGFEEDEGEYCAYLTEKLLAAGDKTWGNLSPSRLPTHLQLAADALANQAPMSPALQQTIVGLLERMAIGAHGDRGRNVYMASDALKAIKHIPEMTTASLTAIGSNPGVNVDLRVDAVYESAEAVGEERIVSLLIAMLTDSTCCSWDAIYDREVFGDTMRVFADEKSKARHTASLVGICTDSDIDINSRVRAVLELASFAEWTTARSLLADVCKDTAVDVRSRVDAAQALGMFGEEATAKSLLADICSDPAVDVRGRVDAAQVLGMLGEEATARSSSLLNDIVTDTEADAWERVAAAEALAFMGEWETAIPLLRDIYNDPDANGRVSVDLHQHLEIYGEWEKKISLSSLSDADLPADAWRYVSAAYSVWTQGWELLSSLDLVYFLTSNVFPSEDYEDYIEDEQVMSVLNDISKDPAAITSDREIAAVGLRILEEIDKAILLLTNIANDETVDDVGRLCAALYIGNLDAGEWNPLAINVLTAVSEDETVNPALRFEAGKALADLEANEVAIPALTDVAGNIETHAEVCIEAAKVLGTLGETTTAETVLKTIVNSRLLSRTNRQDAREALRVLRDEQSDSAC